MVISCLTEVHVDHPIDRVTLLDPRRNCHIVTLSLDSLDFLVDHTM